MSKKDKYVKTMTLVRWGGAFEEVADDDPAVTFICNPGTWPFVTAPVRPKSGPLKAIWRPRLRGKAEALEPLVDWVPSDFQRAGGSIFLSPELGLSTGEVLLVEYSNGTRARVVITKKFGSMAQRMKANQPPPKKTTFDLLEGEDFMK